MKLCLEAFVILKLKKLIQMVVMIRLEFVHQCHHQIEMERIKMVGQYDLMEVMLILLLLDPFIVIKANCFMMIGKIIFILLDPFIIIKANCFMMIGKKMT